MNDSNKPKRVRQRTGGSNSHEPGELSVRERAYFKGVMEDVLGEERFSAAAVFERIKTALGCKSDADLAWLIGVSPQSVWNRKNRNVVPYKEAVLVAVQAGVSLDWLLTGEHCRDRQ